MLSSLFFLTDFFNLLILGREIGREEGMGEGERERERNIDLLLYPSIHPLAAWIPLTGDQTATLAPWDNAPTRDPPG